MNAFVFILSICQPSNYCSPHHLKWNKYIYRNPNCHNNISMAHLLPLKSFVPRFLKSGISKTLQMRSKRHKLQKIISDAAFHCHLIILILSQILSPSLLRGKTILLIENKKKLYRAPDSENSPVEHLSHKRCTVWTSCGACFT